MTKTYTFDVPEDHQFLGLIIPRKKLKEDYLRLFQDQLIGLAMESDFTGTDFRVLLVILGCLDYDNCLKTSMADIARLTGWKSQNISRSLKKLVNKEIFLKYGACGRVNYYKLNPLIGLKARASNYKRIANEWEDIERE